jgi:hypothetical protein
LDTQLPHLTTLQFGEGVQCDETEIADYCSDRPAERPLEIQLGKKLYERYVGCLTGTSWITDTAVAAL